MTFDADALLAALADGLKADRIDLVDLHRAGALLRHRVARDGVPLFERTPGRFDAFWLAAAHAYDQLDMARVHQAPNRAGGLEGVCRGDRPCRGFLQVNAVSVQPEPCEEHVRSGAALLAGSQTSGEGPVGRERKPRTGSDSRMALQD